LASDSSAVDVRIYVRPAYARLVRENSRFWNISGVRLSASLTSGFSFSADSAEALLAGGVALATPPDAGKLVTSGARFELFAEPKKEWEQWRSSLVMTDARVPEETTLPRPVAATLQYRERGYLFGTRSNARRGMVVPVGRHLLGPADLLMVPAK